MREGGRENITNGRIETVRPISAISTIYDVMA